jgi:thymidine phosphorylase
MTSVGELMNVKMSHVLSPMNEPLGRAVGNTLEVTECVQILHGGGPNDLVRLIVDLATKVSTVPRRRLARWLEDGSAWNKFVKLVEAQGGDARTLEKIEMVHRAPIIHPLLAKKSGVVHRMDAESIGRASVLLGAGRQKAGDAIDFAVGLSGLKKIGELVDRDEPLMSIHARNQETLEQVKPMLHTAVSIE